MPDVHGVFGRPPISPLRQPNRQSGTPAGCVDDKVGSYELFAFPILAATRGIQQHADHSLLPALELWLGDQAPHNLDVGELQDPSPQLPFQVRPAGHVGGELLAQGMPRPEDMAGGAQVDTVRPVLKHGHARGHHVVQQAGEQAVEFLRPAGHQHVQVSVLRDRGPVRRRFRQLVALENRHRGVEVREHPRGAQPGDASSDHHGVVLRVPYATRHPRRVPSTVRSQRVREDGCMAGRRRMKSVEQSIADTDEPTTRLRKDLTWWDLVVFGVSVVIGAGIFTVTASTAGDITGPAIWISFLIAAATCALAALCYAEFASTLPVAGSAYTFSYATFGEFLAWVIGWNLVLELAMGAAVVAKGWSSYLGTVFGFGNGTGHLGSLQLDWGALVIVTLVATLIALGTKLSSRFSAVVTAIKVSVVVLVVVVGAFYIRAANYSPFIPEPEVQHHGGGLDQSVFSLLTGAQGSHYGWYGVLAGASIVFFAFIGFDIVATMAEETKRPQRDVPRGILASLGVVTLLYVAVSVVLSGMVPYTQLRTVPGRGPANLATAFQANGVYWASGIISVGALAGLTTVVMVLMLGQCRVLFAMARDGLVPRQLAKTGSRGTPVRVTVLVAVLVATTASVFPITKLEEMVNVGTLFAFILVSAGVVVLRRTRPDLQRGFTAPWVPLLPIAAVCACLWLMLNLTALTWIRFGIWLVAGTAIYVGYGRRHSAQGLRQARESATRRC